jgi:hypothetical protein
MDFMKEFKAILHFDNYTAWTRFLDWWIDGGGEQEANFNSDD